MDIVLTSQFRTLDLLAANWYYTHQALYQSPPILRDIWEEPVVERSKAPDFGSELELAQSTNMPVGLSTQQVSAQICVLILCNIRFYAVLIRCVATDKSRDNGKTAVAGLNSTGWDIYPPQP
ncbi:hypothetical protein J6590_014997 [Homalodisca vitripennis]|nr:hypothetical protein J6590_014997 [Homalodisca vitripennis]